ncbi:glucosidase II beta subunit-like protein-domain-containing protein [Xylariaceae sp. FL0594]|nr:glucosidase II beta subunit-like protein-domain-containing protein [Xylariaceae sp. FL0594]
MVSVQPIDNLTQLMHLQKSRQPGFSIHHDLLAYPQFEVVFSDTYISQSDAQALLDRAEAAHPSYDAELASETDLTATVSATNHGTVSGAGGYGAAIAESYEVITMPPHRYLCAIPVIEPPAPPNKTATDLAKAEEARELARASSHGLDLINELDGTCLYYMSGWWSYRFCYGQDVVQFHAVASSVKGGPPTRDITTAEYVLGRVPDPHVASRASRRGQHRQQNDHDSSSVPTSPTTELQVKGDQRYLVQKMGDGTICDLTGRERTIEIQYHCSPGSTQDRIGWIKEVTTCAYLMLVNTPRLCVDVAFQPPKEERANIISCKAIVPESGEADWHARKTLEAQAAMVGRNRAAAKSPIIIGGVEVGGRHMIGKGENGKEAPKLAPPRNFQTSNSLSQLVEIIAKASGKNEGGDIQVLSEEQLQELDLTPEYVEELKQEIQKIAGDRGWKLELVEVPGNPREVFGVIDGDDDDDDDGDIENNPNKKEEGEMEGRKTGDEGSEEELFKEEL